MDATKIVGWNLRKIRVDRGLTLEDLAGAAEVESSFLAKVERGQANPTLAFLDKLVKVLKIRLVELCVEPVPGAPRPKAMPRGRKPGR
ncbi:helix-turn-helix domain-containing protein [Ferrovibrio sp.]|uniref:helix-turn-helix domain-containing protein n=1 Tax=Ferrovibrio sp. TaxID=1917215 RepID=UPI0035161A09